MVACISFFILILAITLLLDVTLASEFEFGYLGAKGPEKWGSMSKEWKACSDGKQQSPVDIVKDKLAVNNKLRPLARDYKPANATLINFGFNIALRFEENKVGAVTIGSKKFTLKQMHWHTPSEHLIDGQKLPAELHLLHEADDGSIAVVAVLFQIGSNENKFVKKIKPGLNKLAKEVCKGNEQAEIPVGDVDPKPLVKALHKYYRYKGSFTTPPCSENVTWTVLGKVEEITKEQIELLKAPLDKTYYVNSRPVQPLNGRVIELCDLPSKKQSR